MVLDRFNLGRFLEDSSFGNISFEGEVDGKGFRIENINTKLVGQISQIEFNEYNYQDISVNGLYQNNLFNGKLASTDVNLNGTFEGLADLSEEINKFDFKATINYANLRALNLYDRDSISELKGLIDLDLENSRLSKRLIELEGHLTGIKKKLSNDNFVSRAPANVVDYEKKKLEDMSAEFELVKANLEMLQ